MTGAQASALALAASAGQARTLALQSQQIKQVLDMKFKVFLVLLLLFGLLFAGQACNNASYGVDDKSKVHVGIVFDIGGKDDRSFNAAAWAGVKCAETGLT